VVFGPGVGGGLPALCRPHPGGFQTRPYPRRARLHAILADGRASLLTNAGTTMTLKQIEAHNFKSFRDLSVELGQLNVLIGANASGKSNFVQLLRFARDIANLGTENAVSLQGGLDYLNNLALGYSTPFQLRLAFQQESERYGGTGFGNDTILFRFSSIAFDFALQASSNSSEMVPCKDKVVVGVHLYEPHKESDLIGIGLITFFFRNGLLTFEADLPGGLTIDQIFGDLLDRDTAEKGSHQLFLEVGRFIPSLRYGGVMGIPRAVNLVSDISVYDLHAKLPKELAHSVGKIDLEEDGSNLVIALRNILGDPSQRRIFINLVQDILPFVADVQAERFADRFMTLKLREKFAQEQFLPASLLSDGTINIMALIVALYFSDKPLIVIEEPEKNIHPYLIARVANMLKDASRHKQIIVTTHNPEIVRNVGLNDLLLVSRDRDGFSTIRRPAEDRDVQTFLSNEIGIEELFARNLLGA
jgi:predicted ATPase